MTAPVLRYRIEVTLDPDRNRLTGHASIFYRSGADVPLDAIYLHAYPNAFRDHHTIFAREGERYGEDYAIRFASPKQRGWMTIDSVTADGTPVPITLDDTVARIALERPLAPRDSITLRLRFDGQIPKPFARFGHEGNRYSIGQWYPKVAVYDDRGWHPDPYHYFSEFFGDYGTFDVAITLPDRFWVGATGVLRGVEGGDNEIPLGDSEVGKDSVTVHLEVVTADSLRTRWPRTKLEIRTDLPPPDGKKAEPLEVRQDTGVRFRVPRGAPVHYAYAWVESERESRSESDRFGRPDPLHLIQTSRDLTRTDTLRALAAKSAPADTVLPSLKTLRFHADRVHDFGWVACPDYVRADTTWKGIAIRALAYREDQDDWRHQKSYVVSAMEFMTREVGPYIWPSFTSAEAVMGGGAMEYPMLIMNEPDLYSPWHEWLDIVVAHELAHNWFYGMLGSDERADPWLDEGFTQFMEIRYGDWKYPKGVFKRRDLVPWAAKLRDFFYDENRYLTRIYARDEQPILTPADGYHSYPAYGVGAYSKPMIMLQSLAAYFGPDKFRAFLHEYYRANLLRHPRPEDVIRTAEKIHGEDMDAWFRPWLTGTSYGRYSVGGVHHDRIEGERVSTVRVSRKGGRTEPIAVQARFSDGHREAALVPEGRGNWQVQFGGESPVRKMILDPEHDMVEPNRLDNQTGLPPLRFRPLFDFRSSEAMTFLYGPMIWHGRAEGARLGIWTVGRYLPLSDFPEGIVSAGATGAVGTRRGDFSGSLWGGRRVGAFGARGRLDLETARDAGLFRAGIRAGNIAMGSGRLHPHRTWQLGADYRDRYDLAPIDPRYWSPGRGLHGKARLALDTQGPRRAEHFELDGRVGASVFRSGSDPDLRYERASVELRQKLDLFPRGDVDLSWRVFAGSAFDRPHGELLFDAAEGGRVDSLSRFYLNDRGPLLASGHYWMMGGGGLRGYRGRAALGKRVWSVNADLQIPGLPVSFFGDLGRIETTGLGERSNQSAPPASPEAADLLGKPLADAGLSYTYGPIRITMPLYVGRPEPSENPWRFRWLFSVVAIPISL